jgi:Magnesium chelatase, subunit ChlI
MCITRPKDGCKRKMNGGVLTTPSCFSAPGTGTSRLARRLATILPAMTLAEVLETTRIHRVAGLTSGRTAFTITRPFGAPHHTIFDVGAIRGGYVPMPGNLSLAHRDMLFLDKLLECKCHILDILCRPRAKSTTRKNLPYVPSRAAPTVFATRVMRAMRSFYTW